MNIQVDDLSGPEIAQLLTEHLNDMHATSPAESVHALDLSGLKKSNITFWTVWENDQLLGCGALKQLDATHGEIKSMRTNNTARNKGVASSLLQHILRTAMEQGMKKISLETGSQNFFEPARRLYQKYGFTECGPFADYKLDPYSVFMSKAL
ncbi:putative N-acetyltransferase YsnE [Marinomonas spartinae]|uniref:Putative N-acetyltransferase YsnE n=1 Tax=Marinomonas spartinae TaxID=1792290 RepID=A0A1A8T532_9GAMM|nr:GNAT family N-acetyltransferase [Marinomonas spartinae]SBS27421.1 putative N-acetyltransferase YsnE [Marinomonas spartinae]SBS29782.1 putative N-acetyltransferase YsnE [Marinomonas spartinae]